MPRRKSEFDKFLDELLSFLRTMPWWMGPPVILFAWLLFAFALPGVLKMIGGVAAPSAPVSPYNMFASVSAMVAPVIAGVVMLVWCVALVQKLGDGRRLDRQTGLDSIRQLSWREFEQLLGEAFRRQGYSVRDTGPGADGGVDLILTRAGETTVVQAKHWRAIKVPVQKVRELLGVMVAMGADHAILVTSGQATSEAHRFAEDNGIHVMEGPELAALVQASQQHRQPSTRPARQTAPPVASVPAEAIDGLPCPVCGSSMVQRKARRGANAGQAFLGCSTFPSCRGTRPSG